MSQLENTTLEIVREFVKTETLFTALDVSNKVKETIPQARHYEVRDYVRSLFQTEMSPNGYTSTPIHVTLPDGTPTTALLYHHLADSWDLDVKYDAQKRTQTTSRPQAPVAVAPPVVTVNVPVPPVVPQSPRDKWMSLFNSQPSIFAKK